jgi:hypothetical protein
MNDSKISSSIPVMIISPFKKVIRFVGHNPSLKNIIGYLVEKADTEEEEFLDKTSNQPNNSNIFQTVAEQITKVNKKNQSLYFILFKIFLGS